jgi:hypothetical protein
LFDRFALGFAGDTSHQLIEGVGVLKTLERLSFGSVVLIYTQSFRVF